MQILLTKIADTFVQTEEGRQGLVKYFDMKTHPGWKVHQAFLVHMGSMMADDVLSKQFQKLDREERLSRLTAVSMVNEIIKFLLDPTKSLERAAGIVKHNIAMGATIKGATKKEK